MKDYIIVVLASLLGACASPIAPPGGPRDTSTPIVLLQTPQNGTTNYSEDRIEIVFDEYIAFSGGEDRVLVTPTMPSPPKFTVKGKKLIIKLPENLEGDVTYSINLMNAVSDFTEGNKTPLVRCVFATGEKVDSSSLSGSVRSAFDLTLLPNVLVGLYPSSDSVDLKSKPLYLSRTNELGQFRIDYVKKGLYTLAALEDKNFNFIFDQISERISLPSSIINLEGNVILEDEIILFNNEEKMTVQGYKLLNNNKLYFYFSKEVSEMNLKVAEHTGKDKYYFNSNNDTLFYHWVSDTLKSLTFNFTFNNIQKDTFVVPLNKNRLELNLTAAPKVSSSEEIIVYTPKYIDKIFKNGVVLRDSLNKNLKCRVTHDKEFLLVKLLDKVSGLVFLSIDSGCVSYYDGTYNDSVFSKVIELIEKDVASKLTLNYQVELRKNVYLQVLNSEKNLLTSYAINNTKSVEVLDLKSGTYYIRVYQDSNKNSKWNTGNLELNLAPEATLLFSKPIEIKDGWDKEISLSF